MNFSLEQMIDRAVSEANTAAQDWTDFSFNPAPSAQELSDIDAQFELGFVDLDDLDLLDS